MQISLIGKTHVSQLNKLNKQINLLSKDIVNFTGKSCDKFNSDTEAFQFYSTIAKDVNQSLEDDDEITAFETLGYDIDTDFETEKITINGDYKPYFEYRLKNSKDFSLHFISYKKLNIDEEKLLANVENITGSKLIAPDFEPDNDFVIDIEQIYPPAVEAKLEKIVQQRAQKAKEALKKNNTQEALEILGYKTKKDEEGNIAIDGNYSQVLLQKNHSALVLKNFEIDEQELLKDVVEINGSAYFSKEYTPDHYIKIKNIENRGWHQNAKILATMNPEFQSKISKIKESMKNGDNFSALKILGFNAEKNESGKITINGDFCDYFYRQEGEITATINFEELGVDINQLMENISLIDGWVNLYHSKPTKVDKDLVVTKKFTGLSEAESDELFKNHKSNKALYKEYNKIPPSVIDEFVYRGLINPSIKCNSSYYFNEIDSKTEEFLTNISNNRETLLKASEILEKYGISAAMLKHRLESGALHPYAINDVEFRYADTTIIHNFLFDITDEKNKVALKEFEKHLEKKQKELRDSAFFKACEENQVVALEKTANLQGTGLYTFGDIERFGYGTKADLIAHCDLLIDAYETRKRLYDRDIINTSDPTIQAVMKLSKEKNPAIVQLSKLEELIGEDFRQTVIDGKFSIITSTIFQRINKNKYQINLNDAKNMQTLKSIDNKELQEWLKQKEEEIKIYREKNEAIVEEFKRSKAPTKEEAIKAYEAKKFQREIRTVIEADNERIAKKRKAWENKRNLSLRTTIAWVLSPNTREIQKEKVNPTIKEILDRNTQIREIHSLVLAGEITTLEAKEKIRELKLSREEEIAILGFYKGAWEMAGTEEWINALKQAKEIAKLYLKGGLEAIADDKIKNRLELWEKKWGKN